MNIITERPKDMSYEDYRTYRKAQEKALKQYRKGKVVWLSKLYPTPEVMQELNKNNWLSSNSVGRLLEKGETFVGNTKKDLK
jgi:hypothetical protein